MNWLVKAKAKAGLVANVTELGVGALPGELYVEIKQAVESMVQNYLVKLNIHGTLDEVATMLVTENKPAALEHLPPHLKDKIKPKKTDITMKIDATALTSFMEGVGPVLKQVQDEVAAISQKVENQSMYAGVGLMKAGNTMALAPGLTTAQETVYSSFWLDKEVMKQIAAFTAHHLGVQGLIPNNSTHTYAPPEMVQVNLAIGVPPLKVVTNG